MPKYCTKEQVAMVMEMVRREAPTPEIAGAAGISGQSVRNIIRREQIPPNPGSAEHDQKWTVDIPDYVAVNRAAGSIKPKSLPLRERIAEIARRSGRSESTVCFVLGLINHPIYRSHGLT